MTEPSTEISEVVTDISNLVTIDDALEYARRQGELVTSADLTEDGYTYVADKSRLVGTEFTVVKVTMEESESFGGLRATIWFVTKGGYRGKIVDFGTGIRQQLEFLFTKNPNIGGMHCAHGLRVSEYGAHTNANGETMPGGVTYYLDEAPAQADSGHIE